MMKKKPMVLSREMITDTPEARSFDYDKLKQINSVKVVGVCLKIPEDLKDEIKLWCVKNKISMMRAFEEAIRKHINS